jgi:hypothetical protein
MVESPAKSGLSWSGRLPDRTIRRQTRPARRGRRIAVLIEFSAGRRILPAGRRTPGEKSGPAGLTVGASGPEAGAAGLIAGFAAVCSLQRPDSLPPINTPSSS